MSIQNLTKLELSNKNIKDSDNIFQELAQINDLREVALYLKIVGLEQ